DGRGYYVPLWPSELETLQAGDLVTLRERPAASSPGRDRTSARARVALVRESLRLEQQISYVGPVWLDRALPSATPFGAEIANAKQRRRGFLESQKIAERDLAKAERDMLARTTSESLQLRSASKLEGFCGDLVRVHTCPSG